jgi:hypothetical protein
MLPAPGPANGLDWHFRGSANGQDFRHSRGQEVLSALGDARPGAGCSSAHQRPRARRQHGAQGRTFSSTYGGHEDARIGPPV